MVFFCSDSSDPELWTLLSRSFTNVQVKPVTAFSLCPTTPDDVNTRPCICFPCTWDLPVSLSYLITEPRSSDRTRNTAESKKTVTHRDASAVIWRSTHVLVLCRSIVWIPRSPWKWERGRSLCRLRTKGKHRNRGGTLICRLLKGLLICVTFLFIFKKLCKMNNSSRNSDTWSKQHAPYLAAVRGSRSTL